jgi:type IV fimbrial biogenesis protein FimT
MLTALKHPRRHRSAGVTLVELLIAISVTAILLSIATPSMRAFIENVRIRATSESLQNGLALARAEAVRRNQNIEFVRLTTGWVVRVPGTSTALHTASGKEGSNGIAMTMAPTGADRITYDSFGRTVANADSSASLTTVDIASAHPPSVGNYRPLRVQIQATGAPRVCNPAVGTSDPRACL